MRLGLNCEPSKRVFVDVFFLMHVCDMKFMCNGRDSYEAHISFLYNHVKHL